MSGLRRSFITCLLAVALWAGTALPLSAQEDFRNTDRGRPLLVEDSYPLELREWEFEFGGRGRLAEGSGQDGAGLRAGLKTGLPRNTQVGLEFELAAERDDSGTEFGFGGVGAHVLHNLNREAWSWPAFAVRAEVHGPGSASIGRDDWSFELTGLATRSVGRLRLHANGGRRFGTEGRGRDAWRAGLAADYPIGLFSRLVMADVFVEVPEGAGRTRMWLELGSRWQLTNSSVLDLGLATRLDEWEVGRANAALTLGFSLAFGIPGLTPVPPYPNPVLD